MADWKSTDLRSQQQQGRCSGESPEGEGRKARLQEGYEAGDRADQSDADCDDGIFCNGAETCGAGFCQSGAAGL